MPGSLEPSNSSYSVNSTMYQYPSSSLGVVSYGTNVYAIYTTSVNCIDLIDSDNVTTTILSGAGNNYSISGYGISPDGSIICIFTYSGNSTHITEVIVFNTTSKTYTTATCSTEVYNIAGYSMITISGTTINAYCIGLRVLFNVTYPIQLTFSSTTPTALVNNSNWNYRAAIGTSSNYFNGCFQVTIPSSSSTIVGMTREFPSGQFYTYDFTNNAFSSALGGNATSFTEYYIFSDIPGGVTRMYAIEGTSLISYYAGFTSPTTVAFLSVRSTFTSAITAIPGYPANSIGFSQTGGSGLPRYYLMNYINPNSYIAKLYATSGGSSTGGDPKVVAIYGREITITPEDPFLYFDSHPKEDKMIRDRVYIWCESFNVGSHPELMSEYQHIHVDGKESFLKNMKIFFSNKKYEVDLVNLCYAEEFTTSSEESKFSISFSEIVDCNKIPRVEYPNIRSKKYLNDLLLFRKIKIESEELSLDIEIIRTKCINYSDINTYVSGKKSLEEYSGVILNGEVTTPILP